MSNGSKTNFCYISNDVIRILKPVDRKISLPRLITLPHFFPMFSNYASDTNTPFCHKCYQSHLMLEVNVYS